MTFDPTTSAAWIVQGEEDVGPQRRCRVCRDWFPLVPDCWRVVSRMISHASPGRPRKGTAPFRYPFRRIYYVQPCLACFAAAKRAA